MSLDEVCRYALEGPAKRLRPQLVLMVAPEAHVAADAVEYLHTASLIADDLPCMDDARERRGRPSLHRVFGESRALLASYALIAEAYRLVANIPHAVEAVSEAMGTLGVVGGQILDLQLEAPSKAAYLRICRLKTGALFGLALQLGWLYERGNRAELPLLQEEGEQLGIFFQLRDDLKDGDGAVLFFGEEWAEEEMERAHGRLERTKTMADQLV